MHHYHVVNITGDSFRVKGNEVIRQPERQIDMQFDSYVQELIKERFMEYARFIHTNSLDRIWRINKTALQSAGYQLGLN